VIVYDVERFGRDLAENALGLRRLKEAGARLVAITQGFDSARGGEIEFAVHSALAEKTLRRSFLLGVFRSAVVFRWILGKIRFRNKLGLTESLLVG
jgi:hypothetical protein